ncbi:Gfo/Idh/MocA family protein [Algoriphagus namhaensis]
MKKGKARILVLGIGSIGRRHVDNLLTLGYDQIALVSRREDLSDIWPELKVFKSFEEAIASHAYTHGFICTETSRHFEDLEKLLKAGFQKIYLEKPIGHTLSGLDSIQNLLTPEHRVAVGFDLRFDPAIHQVRSLLSEGRIGRLLGANAFVGQYLPDWRPHEDYRLGSSAIKKRGGGVLLDLVHEFDYLTYLLGEVDEVAGIYRQTGALEIETEDQAEVLLRFQSKVIGQVHLDYLQRQLLRYAVFTGSEGTIHMDLATKSVTLKKSKGEEEVWEYTHTTRNDRFLDILEAFMSDKKDSPLASFDEGLQSLKIVLAVKKSSETHTFVGLNSFED